MTDAPSSARRFFDRIMNAPDPAAFIRGLTTSEPATREEEWLDFKVAGIDKDAKRNWSRALSGFANTEGGVIVWGVIAKKDSDDVDAANGIEMVVKPESFASRLMELHHSATDPPVAGVEASGSR